MKHITILFLALIGLVSCNNTMDVRNDAEFE